MSEFDKTCEELERDLRTEEMHVANLQANHIHNLEKIKTLTKQLQVAREALEYYDRKGFPRASEALTKIDELEGKKSK